MKKTIFLLLLLTTATLTNYSQQPITAIVHDPPIPYIGNLNDWGTDLLVSNYEPLGRCSGLVRPTDTLYIAIPDSSLSPGTCGSILRSTNNGVNWSIVITVSPATVIAKTRMVRSGLDSIYCVALLGAGPYEGQIFILKVNLPLTSSSLRTFLNGGYRDFDCWASSTGGFYLFPDSLYSGSLPRYASSTGGVTWSQRGLVTSTAANPFIYKSGSGDTCILAYYQLTAVSDTTTCAITIARYREVSIGSLSSIAFLTSIIPAGTPKDQFGGNLNGSFSWFLYTSGAPGSRDIMYILSMNGGANYSTPAPLANNPNIDEYYFDIQHFTLGAAVSGADIIYFSDSTGSTNTSDKLMYTSATNSAPTTFSTPLQISEHPPVSSPRNYIPFLMEYYNTGGDVGAVWTGLDGSNRRVYFDRLVMTGIHTNNVPVSYSLSQNYPNPFNPVTKIDYSIAQRGVVKIQVYDILGRNVAVLVNSELNPGSYSVNFDATGLSSGIYFYRMTSGDFISTKKMVILK
ncbi:MAG: T9SS type A sorting domain-containing protein [Ignavibacteria bacterium]